MYKNNLKKDSWLCVFRVSFFRVILCWYSLPEWPQPVKRHEALKHDCSVGRSMIEMLGVLAIIAALTAGGLVGFNKAMLAYHWNMALGQWDTLINVVVKYKSQLHINDGSQQDLLSLLPIFEATGELPDSMFVENCGTTKRNCYVVDAMRNKIRVYNHNTGYIGIGYLISQNNIEACRLFMTMAKSYHNTVDIIQFYTNDRIDDLNTAKNIHFYGDRYCYGNNTSICLKDLSVSQINEICKDNKVCKDRKTCNFLMYWVD